MKHFAALIAEVEMTNKTTAKIDALVRYFRIAPDKDKLWVIQLFTGKRPKRPVTTKLMREWCLAITGIPEWLFLESYSAVGDLGETISLVLPEPSHQIEQSLSQWMAELAALVGKSDAQKRAYVERAWSGLAQPERLIFNKLIGGSFRIGISKKTLVNALAKLVDKDPNLLMHSIIGNWDIHTISFDALISGEHINYDHSKPYPFCLAYALEKSPAELGKPSDWQAEYKWDGIRGQIVKRGGEVYIWSRGEELVTAQFPEMVEALVALDRSFVIDGEILPLKEGSVLKFNDLQKRLNRKTLSKKLRAEVPIGFYAYDCLEIDQQDIRAQPLQQRREKLETLFRDFPVDIIRLSEVIDYQHWEALDAHREAARARNSEGLMLKHQQSVYHVGRKKGDWWKWKVDPLTIDAVMIYAQRGSGRRSGHYTDYTFAVRTGQVNANGDPELVPIAKAYSGLTNQEITEVSRFVRQNGLEKFGPVRTVKPELVFEIAFEGIALSNRHKSGVALRFPRIARWRRDKPVAEIDTVESVKALIDVG